MMMMHRILIAALALVAAAWGARAEPLDIRVAWSSPLTRAGYLPHVTNLLHHYGQSYTIEAVHFTNAPAELTALAAGDIDIAQFTAPVLGAAVENAHMIDIRLIAQESEDGVPGYASTAFYVRTDGPVKDIADLKHRVVGVNAIGSLPDIEVRYTLRRHGLEEGRDYTEVELPFGNMRPALAEGKIDLGSMIMPYLYDPALAKIGRPLFRAVDEVGSTEGPGWVARAGFIAKNRAALVDFLEDALRAQHWLTDPGNRHEALALASKLVHQPPEVLGWLFTARDEYRNPDGEPDLKAIQHTLDIERELGLLKRDIVVAKYADLTLVDEAYARLDK
jgi:ABC-type nitrate/sulfonate/bicarbonate transport system substrate-binding protein